MSVIVVVVAIIIGQKSSGMLSFSFHCSISYMLCFMGLNNATKQGKVKVLLCFLVSKLAGELAKVIVSLFLNTQGLIT